MREDYHLRDMGLGLWDKVYGDGYEIMVEFLRKPAQRSFFCAFLGKLVKQSLGTKIWGA